MFINCAANAVGDLAIVFGTFPVSTVNIYITQLATFVFAASFMSLLYTIFLQLVWYSQFNIINFFLILNTVPAFMFYLYGLGL